MSPAALTTLVLVAGVLAGLAGGYTMGRLVGWSQGRVEGLDESRHAVEAVLTEIPASIGLKVAVKRLGGDPRAVLRASKREAEASVSTNRDITNTMTYPAPPIAPEGT